MRDCAGFGGGGPAAPPITPPRTPAILPPATPPGTPPCIPIVLGSGSASSLIIFVSFGMTLGATKHVFIINGSWGLPCTILFGGGGGGGGGRGRRHKHRGQHTLRQRFR